LKIDASAVLSDELLVLGYWEAYDFSLLKAAALMTVGRLVDSFFNLLEEESIVM